MKLRDLLCEDARCEARFEGRAIAGVSADSRVVKPGFLFVAVPGTKADVPGYYVGGKTGTAEKVFGGHYVKTRLMTDVMAVLPSDDPRYLVLIMLDEPQASAETHGFATSGWNAVPVAAKVISRVAPLLGVQPRFELPPADRLILASVKDSR